MTVVSIALCGYYGKRDPVPHKGWTQIHSKAATVLDYSTYGYGYGYGKHTPESLMKEGMSEMPLIEDGKSKVQQIRDRQNEKKQKSRERKMNQKKQTQGLKSVRDECEEEV